MRNIVTYGLANIAMFVFIMAFLFVAENAQKKLDMYNQENVVIRYDR